MRFIPCEKCPLRRKLPFKKFTIPELDFVRALKTAQIDLPEGQVIIAPGMPSRQLFTLLSGWAFRFRLMPNGERQIIDVLLPGSLLGLQQLLLGRSDSGVESLTPVTLCVLDGRPLSELFLDHRHLAAAMVQTLMEEEERSDIRLGLVGRRSGPERLAYFLLETFDRLVSLDMVDGEWCYFPLHRPHLADLLGLSDTHVSRSLRELRKRKFADIGSNILRIVDRPGIGAFSGYVGLTYDAPRLLL